MRVEEPESLAGLEAAEELEFAAAEYEAALAANCEAAEEPDLSADYAAAFDLHGETTLSFEP